MRYSLSRRITTNIFLVNFVANTSGAMLTTFYFTNLASNPFQVSAQSNISTAILVAMTVVLLGLGSFWVSKSSQPLTDWLNARQANPNMDRAPEKIRRLVIEFPLLNAEITLAMWLLAGLFVSSWSAWGDPINWDIFVRSLFGISVISGFSTTVLIYFAVEQAWKPALAYFFPQGDITQTHAFRLTVRWRLLILFVMGLVPLYLLAVLAYNITTQIAGAPQPLLMLSYLRDQELFITGVSTLGIIILAVTLGNSLVAPLEQIGTQMIAVQRGDLDVRLQATSNDEFGQLIAGFNSMLEGLRQEQVIRRLFGRYVTPQVADYAIQHGAELGGQVVQASVLFADIRDFTGLTERVEPSALIDMLNRYFETMSAVIVAHGGLVNKYGGDSLLALFGSPLNPDEQHSHQAVRAAQGLVAALEKFNRDQHARGESALQIGVGVATGAIVVGNVGSRERLEYTALGDTVNLASRLQTMTKSLKTTILLNETTAQAVKIWANLQSIGQVNVRGKAEPEWVYAPVAAD